MSAAPPGARSAPASAPSTLRIRVVSGPNLDLLGAREPEIYGAATLDDIHRKLAVVAKERDAEVECLVSNHEGDLVTWVGRAGREGAHGIVLNAGALTHTSIALLDAIRASGLPVVEVHLSNPEAREPFRRRSRIAAGCVAKVAGFGAASYVLGLVALVDRLRGAPDFGVAAR